ncbi:MAG: hypothetical protein JSW42_08710 [Chloroflexota bacterium]|nr:MAG: hypothetical protein JSW42_08710 [Chloroflexota bacterium]
MEQNRLVPMDMPATYRICVTGYLESELTERRWGMTSDPVEKIGELEQTALIGEVADQATLIGIINALYNSGHTVVSVERLLPDANPNVDNMKEEA